MSKNAKTPIPMGRKILVWTLISVIAGLIGGGVGMLFTAPFFFGFFMALVLTGLVALFAIAVDITNEQQKKP